MKKIMMVFLLVMLGSATHAAQPSLDGIWILPDRDGERTELTMASKGKRLAAVLTVNKNCSKPIHTLLAGEIGREGKELTIALTSEKIPMPDKCVLKLMIGAKGRLTKPRRFRVRIGMVISILNCPGKTSAILSDDISGNWTLKKRKKDAITAGVLDI